VVPQRTAFKMVYREGWHLPAAAAVVSTAVVARCAWSLASGRVFRRETEDSDSEAEENIAAFSAAFRSRECAGAVHGGEAAEAVGDDEDEWTDCDEEEEEEWETDDEEEEEEEESEEEEEEDEEEDMIRRPCPQYADGSDLMPRGFREMLAAEQAFNEALEQESSEEEEEEEEEPPAPQYSERTLRRFLRDVLGEEDPELLEVIREQLREGKSPSEFTSELRELMSSYAPERRSRRRQGRRRN